MLAREREIAKTATEGVQSFRDALTDLRDSLPDLDFINDEALEGLPDAAQLLAMRTTLDPTLVTAVTEQVWLQFLGIDIAPAAADGAAECAASIAIEGAWNGAIIVACSHDLARQAAAAMFGCPVSEIGDVSWRDTLNEVANIMGGNLKGLLPGPSTLGLPEAFDTWQPAADDHTVAYHSTYGPLYVTVFPC